VEEFRLPDCVSFKSLSALSALSALLILVDFKNVYCVCFYYYSFTGGCECFLPCCPAHIVSCLAYRVAPLEQIKMMMMMMTAESAIQTLMGFPLRGWRSVVYKCGYDLFYVLQKTKSLPLAWSRS